MIAAEAPFKTDIPQRTIIPFGKTEPAIQSSIQPRTKPKLLDQKREAMKSRHYSRRTEETYCHWVKRFIFFHKVRHPAEMAEPEINAFLTHLDVKDRVSSSTQNQALSALLFLYRYVINRKIGDLGEVIRARKPKRVPAVKCPNAPREWRWRWVFPQEDRRKIQEPERKAATMFMKRSCNALCERLY